MRYWGIILLGLTFASFFYFQAKIESIRQKKEDDAEKLLRTQFKMEMLVYTQDRTYSSSLNKRKKEEQEEDEHILGVKGFVFKVPCNTNNHANQATMAELILHLKSYYRVSVDHSTIQTFSFAWRKTSDNIFFLMLQIASQRLADQIPLVIRYHMLQEFASQLQREMLQLLQDKEKIESLVKEDCDVGTKRASLQSRLKRLTQARAYLVKF